MSNAALTSDSTPALTWTAVSGANLYRAQVSLYADFSTIAASDSALGSASFTPGSALTTGNKYYWRWASSTDGGTTWSAWSSKYSFWLDTTFSVNVTPADNWIFVNATDITDRYTLAVYPLPGVMDEQVLRAQRRNLQGSMLIENVTMKARIVLVHEGAYVSQAQRAEIERFYNMAEGFWLLGSVYNGTEYVENVWKVVFASPPQFNALAEGRQDFWTTTLEFEEV